MTKTRAIREGLQRLLERHGNDLPAEVLESCAQLMNQFKQHDRTDFSKVLAMFASSSRKPVSPPTPTAHDIAEVLRQKLLDSGAFSMALEEISTQRPVTKAVLSDVYKLLYRRSRGVRATMSRDELLDLIQNERNILLRHGTLESLTLPSVKVAD